MKIYLELKGQSRTQEISFDRQKGDFGIQKMGLKNSVKQECGKEDSIHMDWNIDRVNVTIQRS